MKLKTLLAVGLALAPTTAPDPKDILSAEIFQKCWGMDIWRTDINNQNNQ